MPGRPVYPIALIATGVAAAASALGLFALLKRRLARREQAADTGRQFRALVEHIPVVTYSWDATHATGMIAPPYVSPQIESMLGFTHEELKADPDLWLRSLHPEDREQFVEASERSAMTGEPFGMEYRVLARDGRVVWIRDEAVVVAQDEDRKSTRLNSSHIQKSRMPSSA